MGRNQKNPSYNSEVLFKELLTTVTMAYHNKNSVNAIGDELGMNRVKIRKLLISAGVYESDIADEINEMKSAGKSIAEIMKKTNLSRASVYSYLPYTHSGYKAQELSLDAENCRKYRERELAVRKLKNNSVEELWQALVVFQEYTFRTASGLPFKYSIKKGRNGRLTRELVIDRREQSKTLTWSSIKLAYEKAIGMKVVERPKALGDIRGASYIYPIFWRLGIINVPEKYVEKMQRPQERNNNK